MRVCDINKRTQCIRTGSALWHICGRISLEFQQHAKTLARNTESAELAYDHLGDPKRPYTKPQRDITLGSPGMCTNCHRRTERGLSVYRLHQCRFMGFLPLAPLQLWLPHPLVQRWDRCAMPLMEQGQRKFAPLLPIKADNICKPSYARFYRPVST